MTLVLASASPRRHELLDQAGIPHRVQPADIDETPLAGERPLALSVRLAREKALAVAKRIGAEPRRRVLGSDTIVVLDDEAIGKPADAEDAVRMLQRLAGRTHVVVTAVAIVDSASFEVWDVAVESRVSMREAGEADIRRYVATGEPLDKAGSYAIQGKGSWLVTGLEGSRSNVIGLPLEETRELLARAGHSVPDPT